MISVPTSALVLRVEERLRHHQLEDDGRLLRLHGPGLDLRLVESTCNAPVIARWRQRLDDIKRMSALYADSPHLPLRYVLDGVRYGERKETKRGAFLTSLPLHFKILVRESDTACSSAAKTGPNKPNGPSTGTSEDQAMKDAAKRR